VKSLKANLDRLNKSLSEITTKRIRIVWWMLDDIHGSKSIVDIADWKRQWIVTPKRGELSAEGKSIILDRMEGDVDWSLIELDNASE